MYRHIVSIHVTKKINKIIEFKICEIKIRWVNLSKVIGLKQNSALSYEGKWHIHNFIYHTAPTIKQASVILVFVKLEYIFFYASKIRIQKLKSQN